MKALPVRLPRVFGIFFILVALILIGLLVSQYQISINKSHPIWEGETFQIPPGYSWLNATLNPSRRQEYRAIGSIVPMLSDNILPDLDLWVVNQTGLDLLIEERSMGIAPPGFPPRAYALVWDIEDDTVRNFELSQMDYPGKYYFYFENYFASQTVSITLTESWVETSALVGYNPLNFIVILSLMILGIYLLTKRPKTHRKKSP